MSETFGSFDPETFGIGGFLDQAKGVIKEARFETFDYNGTVDPPAHGLKVLIARLDENGEESGERTERYGLGKGRASEDGRNYTGTITGGCRFAKFLKHLKAAGYKFPKDAEGIEVLEGTVFEWKHMPLPNDKDYATVAKLVSDAESKEADAADEDFNALLVGLVIEALRNGPPPHELKKLAVKNAVAPNLEGNPNKTKALTMLISDSFYAGTDALVLDGGIVSAA